MGALWNDPFRMLLVISLVALVGWIVAHSGAQGASASRARAGDVDQGDSTGIFVSVDDDSPFGLPFDEIELDVDPADAVPVASPPGSPGPARATPSGRGATGAGDAGGTTRQPSTDRGGTSLPPGGTTTTETGTSPATDGTSPGGNGNGTGNGNGNGANPVPPVVPPGQVGTPGTPASPGIPGVDLPLPAVPGPGGTSSGHGVGGSVPEAPLLAPLAPLLG